MQRAGLYGQRGGPHSPLGTDDGCHDAGGPLPTTARKDCALIDAPPDFGPESSRWEEMVKLGRESGQLQDVVRDARQIAPVAILLGPIRSFAVELPTDFRADSPLRNELVHVIQQCLDRQVGVHFFDQADLWRSQVVDRELRLGK